MTNKLPSSDIGYFTAVPLFHKSKLKQKYLGFVFLKPSFQFFYTIKKKQTMYITKKICIYNMQKRKKKKKIICLF